MTIIYFLLWCQFYTFTFHLYITLLLIHFLPDSNETPSPKDEPMGNEAITQESLAAAETCDVPQLKDVNLSTEPLSDNGLTEHLCSAKNSFSVHPNRKTHIFLPALSCVWP